VSAAFEPIAVEALYAAPQGRLVSDPTLSWVRRAAPIIRAHQRTFVLSLIFSFVGLILSALAPDVLRLAIDHALTGRGRHLANYAIGLAILAVAIAISNGLARTLLLRVANRLEFELRALIYNKLARLSPSFYDTTSVGELMSRANSDVRAVQIYLVSAPSIFVQCSIAPIVFVLMLVVSVPLALLTMATVPFTFWIGLRMRRRMYPVSWLIQSRLAEVATVVDESIGGVRVVKAFAAEQRQLDELALRAERVRWGYIRDSNIRALWSPLMESLPRLGLAMLLIVGGLLELHSADAAGTLISFSSYVLLLQAPFRGLGMVIMMSQRASASAGRIYEFIDEPEGVQDVPDAQALERCRGEIRFENAHFGYADGGEVLRGLDLKINPGECVAIVGAAGSGKSTIGRLIARYYDPTEGHIRVDGHDIRELMVTSLRHHIGHVPDEPFLFSATLHENIAFGRPNASRAEVRAAASAAEADGFIEALPHGYDTVIGERGYTLSGGQRQRVAIARALLVDPKILLLDDATSAIDVHTEQRIHVALTRLTHERTTVIFAHRLSTIGLADRVVMIQDGRVVADGQHLDLMRTHPEYGSLFSTGEAAAQAGGLRRTASAARPG
jgi:ATP-binding cassette subfamily B protein